MVYKNQFPQLKMKTFGPCWLLITMESNAYLLEMPEELDIYPLIHILDLYDYTQKENMDQIEHLAMG